MPFIQTTQGLAFEDKFNRANNPVVGNDWDETIRGLQNIRIQDNTLDSATSFAGVNEVYQFGDAADPNPIPLGDTIIQINGDWDFGAGSPRVQLMLRTSEGVAGVGSEDTYRFWMDKSISEIRVAEVIGGVVQQNDSAVFAPGTTQRGLRLVLEDNGPTNNILTGRVTPALANLQDLTEDFTAASVTITDSTSPIAVTGNTTDYAILTVNNVLMDKFMLMGRGIVINTVPTGWKISIDGGVTKVAEVAGTVAFNVDTAFLPRTTMKAYNAADVQKDAFSGFVYGGSVFDFRRYPEDAMVTGVFR